MSSCQWCARIVAKQFANTLVSQDEMVTHEEESISLTKKHKMRTSQFSNLIQFIITSCLDRQGAQREWILKTFKEQFWWIAGTRWEGWEWIECSIGGGEGIKRYKNGGPPTLYQPASQQGGLRRWKNLAGGAWGGGRCAGALGWIFGTLGFYFHQGVYFHHLCARGWSGRPMFQLLAEMNEKRQIGESESVSYCLIVIILLFLRFGDQCLKRCWTRKYSQINVLYFEASRSSFDQLE